MLRISGGSGYNIKLGSVLFKGQIDQGQDNKQSHKLRVCYSYRVLVLLRTTSAPFRPVSRAHFEVNVLIACCLGCQIDCFKDN